MERAQARSLQPAREKNAKVPAKQESSANTPTLSLLHLQRSVGNRAVQGLIRTRTAGQAIVGRVPAQRLARALLKIQRYQAGEAGHGKLEQEAMRAAGFSAGEAKQIYRGNWLRDFSQLAPLWEKTPEIKLPLMQVLNLIALGEFGREITAADLGTYVASEHLDNPLGGPSIESPEVQKDTAKVTAAYSKLSPAQQQMYDRVEAEFAAKHDEDKSGLPDYLQRGEIRIKLKLEDAVRAGKTDGMPMLGDALHTVEDYFSHSNFISVAIYTLQQEGAVPPSLAENKAKVDAVLGADTALLDAKGRPQIVTGTYATGADTGVSVVEGLKTALHSDEMSRALTLGAMRKLGITPEQVGQRVGAGLGGALGRLGGSVAGGVSGEVSGIASGAKAGWERNSGIAAIGSAIWGGIWGGIKGGARGAVEGGSAGEKTGEKVGAAAGGALGAWANKSLDEIVDMLGVERIKRLFADISPTILALDALLDYVSQTLAKESTKQAKKQAVGGPTHSQLSKDAPDNPLFGASVALAQEADKKIGEKVKEAWESPSPGDTTAIDALVDTYISMPADNGWWRSVLIGFANKRN